MEIESETQQEEEQKHFHVLAVDDSFIDRKLLEKLLKVSSYRVTCLESGDKALEYLGLNAINNIGVDDFNDSSSSPSSSSSSSQHKGVKVNLIMTDYCMPGMSGYDLLKRVKGSSSWKNVPVVVMSSENVPSRVSMCLEGGAEEFLLKPVRLSDVKKIHPYILRSLPLSSRSTDVINEDDICLDGDDNISSDNHSKNKIKKKSNGSSKRKAMSIDPPEKRAKNDRMASTV
ncbi:PREDICTED: two-component response regulator ORR9-like isoform X2 [Tarenaya hassleriana]|uniref:two-component response regulator ORR9-like isoform X2 n=1 Tax=Tarenaya hassleriana TaxID=28532 RepID=UPI00053C3866|nr:PREDICTED: two-component response regulator ORR9-like isoform X2 [Tarenaya hassleriana]